jgi:hypothetical protein
VTLFDHLDFRQDIDFQAPATVILSAEVAVNESKYVARENAPLVRLSVMLLSILVSALNFLFLFLVLEDIKNQKPIFKIFKNRNFMMFKP